MTTDDNRDPPDGDVWDDAAEDDAADWDEFDPSSAVDDDRFTDFDLELDDEPAPDPRDFWGRIDDEQEDPRW